ncbi:MAG: carbohydrate ABC transporter permease [Christensenellales bacterium]|jgi:multiple sugar transport system permease protein
MAKNTASAGRSLSRTRRQAAIGMGYILPSFILMLTFNIIPIFMSLFYSFTKFSMAKPPVWIGLQNYQKLFSNKTVIASVGNTVRYTLMTVPVQTILALIISAFIAEKLQNRYGSFLRSVIFVPVVISLIASASIWNLLYEAKDGLINQFLTLMGFEKVNFLGSKNTALASVAAVAVWKSTGYYMVIYYAGMMNISPEIKEAATVDGAKPWQRFIYITLPILKPITYMVVTLGIIGSFQVFDLVYKMTGGGPGRATYTVAYMIYSYAFQDKRIGYASAIAIMLLLVILLIHLLQTLIFREKEQA